MELTPGRAVIEVDGRIGITARLPLDSGRPDFVGVVHGRMTIIIAAAEDVGRNWHAVAFSDGSIGGRRPGARGRRGVRTIAGARWLGDVKRGDVGMVRMSGSGPHGGRPR